MGRAINSVSRAFFRFPLVEVRVEEETRSPVGCARVTLQSGTVRASGRNNPEPVSVGCDPEEIPCPRREFEFPPSLLAFLPFPRRGTPRLEKYHWRLIAEIAMFVGRRCSSAVRFSIDLPELPGRTCSFRAAEKRTSGPLRRLSPGSRAEEGRADRRLGSRLDRRVQRARLRRRRVRGARRRRRRLQAQLQLMLLRLRPQASDTLVPKLLRVLHDACEHTTATVIVRETGAPLEARRRGELYVS